MTLKRDNYDERLHVLDDWMGLNRRSGRIDAGARAMAVKVVTTLHDLERDRSLSDRLRNACRKQREWLELVLAYSSCAREDFAEGIVELAGAGDAAFGLIPHLMLYSIEVLSIVGGLKAMPTAIAATTVRCVGIPSQMRLAPLHAVARALRSHASLMETISTDTIEQLLGVLADDCPDPLGQLAAMKDALQREQSRRR